MNELTLISGILYFLAAGIFISLASYMDTQIMRSNQLSDNSKLRSACDNCGKQLHWYELLPLISFIALRGKCSSCGAKIEIKIFFAEIFGLITGILFAAHTLIILTEPVSTAVKVAMITTQAAIFVILLYLSIYDLFTYSMPTWTLNVLGIIAVGANVVWLVMTQYGLWSAVSFAAWGSAGNLAVGMFAGLLFGLIIAITKEKGLGLGDLYLAAFLGLLLGWPNIIAALYVMLGSSITVGLLYCLKIRKFKGVILPLVPFITLGYMVAVTLGESIFRLLFPFV